MDVLSKDTALQSLFNVQQQIEAHNNDGNDSDDLSTLLELKSFWEYVRNAYYYDNNMNTISNAMMVLVELTVVNQWHVVSRMFIELTSNWSYLYFYFFYFVSVLLVMNVLTAFVLDVFITQYEAEDREKARDRRKREKDRRKRKFMRQHKKWKERQKKRLMQGKMKQQKDMSPEPTFEEMVELDDSMLGDKDTEWQLMVCVCFREGKPACK